MTPEQLRASILRNAFDGKLVEQNSNEEPSINMINDIRKEQERLIKLKEIKKEKIDTSITCEEKLPEGWCLAKLGELTRVVTKQTGFDYSKTIKPNLLEYKAEGTIPLVQTKNFKGKEFSLDTDYYIPMNIAKDFPKILLDGKCILLSIVGASIGNVGLYTLTDLGMIGGAICKVQLINDLLYDYLYYYLQSPLGQNEIRKNYKATAQGTITVQDVREIIIKIPPLEEQHRIVAKIEELLPYVDRYAESYEKLERFNAKFPEDMKKSILQYAIQGKLVEQRPEEGTAEELYQQIQEEKQKLIEEGKIKKEKPLPEITEDEIPFDIPDSWKWVRLKAVGELSRGKSKHRPRNDASLFEGGGWPFIQTGDVAQTDYRISSWNTEYNEKGLVQSRLWKKGTLCLTIAANIGDVAILDFDACFPDSVVGFNAFKPIMSNEYFLFGLMCYKSILDKMSRSTAQKNINLDILSEIAFPLPPLKEQERIVSRLKELLPYCDRLVKV